jgi:hypothetical protein
VYPSLEILTCTTATAKNSLKLSAETAIVLLQLNAALKLSKHANKNVEPRLHATAKREFVSHHQTATARHSPNANALLL